MKRVSINDNGTKAVLFDFGFDETDKTLLPRFRRGLKQLHRLERVEKQGIRRALAGYVKSDHITAHSREQVARRNQAIEIFEGLLGTDAVRKIYAAAYEANSDFMPSVKMLADILVKITGEVKQLTCLLYTSPSPRDRG